MTYINSGIIAGGCRTRLSLSMLLIDVDLFKSVNDTYGHLVGDQVLYNLAQLIKGNVRDFDRVFCCLIPSLTVVRC